MHKQRIAILAVAAVGMLATFLPWVTLPFVGSVPGSAGDGWITFGLFAVAIIVSLLGDRSQPMSTGMLLGATIPADLAMILGIVKIIDFQGKMGDMGDTELARQVADSVSIGIGIYLVVACGLLVTVLGFALKRPNMSDEVAASTA